jgi:predicted transcriptional regulator of viral defense system
MTFMPDKWVLDRLYPVAEAQLGHFTTHQAEELGVDRRYLTHHLRSGNLERVERGIYRLRNYPRHPFEDVMAATLWVGEGSAASHDTALAIYGLADAMPSVIHITVDRRFRGDRPGVVLHKARLPNEDVANREGIPVTTPLRTLADVAMDRSVAEAAASEALDRGLVREAQLRDLAASRPELAGLIGSLLNR